MIAVVPYMKLIKPQRSKPLFTIRAQVADNLSSLLAQQHIPFHVGFDDSRRQSDCPLSRSNAFLSSPFSFGKRFFSLRIWVGRTTVAFIFAISRSNATLSWSISTRRRTKHMRLRHRCLWRTPLTTTVTVRPLAVTWSPLLKSCTDHPEELRPRSAMEQHALPSGTRISTVSRQGHGLCAPDEHHSHQHVQCVRLRSAHPDDPVVFSP